jgi:hypothetical protein
VELETILLGKIIQTQKDKYHMLSHDVEFRSKKRNYMTIKRGLFGAWTQNEGDE